MALPPHPPAPITLMRAPESTFSTNSIIPQPPLPTPVSSGDPRGPVSHRLARHRAARAVSHMGFINSSSMP
jgi:hypothetical protein